MRFSGRSRSSRSSSWRVAATASSPRTRPRCARSTRWRPAERAQADAERDGRRRALLRGGAGADLRRAGLLARTGVAVQRAALDGLVDRPHELEMLGVGRVGIAALDGGLQAAEVRLDRRGVAPVLEALALGADDRLLL